jgi:TRAP-type mannitol/chloroaromatic compound transport system permease small subunit
MIKYVGYLSAFVVALLVILVFYDAMARYLFSYGSIALQELEWHLFDIIILFGISYTLRENAHVRVDIFYASYTKKNKVLIDMISSLFFILPFSLLIVYIGLEFVSLSFSQNEVSSSPGGLEYRYLVKALMPLAFFFLAFQTLIDFKNNYTIWKNL